MAPRIALLANALGVGGVERQLVQTSRTIAQAGWPVFLIALHGRRTDAFMPELRPHVDHMFLLGEDLRSDVQRLTTLRRLLAHLRVDVCYSFTAKPNVLNAVAGLTGGPARVVWGVRDSPGWRASEGMRRSRRFEAWMSRFTDQIIYNSHAGLSQYRAAGHRGSGVVVQNGIDTERFRPDPAAAAAVRGELGLSPGQRLVGMVSRLHPKKGIDAYARAAGEVAAARPDVVFLHVGGPESEREALARRHAEVVFLGQRSDVERVMAALDVFCLPSVYGEGFPNVVAEAMAAGTPCVVTPVGDAAAIVGDTGAVASTPEELGPRLLQMLDEVEVAGDALTTACRERVVRCYSIPVFERRLLDCLAAAGTSRRPVRRSASAST